VKPHGPRQQRIVDQLVAGGNNHSVATMNALQGDTFSLYGEAVVPALLTAASTATLTPEEQDVVDALTAWQLTCPTGVDGADPAASPDVSDPAETAEAIGCAAFHATLFAVTHAALGDELAAAAALAGEPSISLPGRLDTQLVVRAIMDPTSIASGDLMWDDVSTAAVTETRDEILLRGITLAAEALAVNGAPNDWRWGRLHTLSLRSIFDSFGVPTYNDGPYAAPGGLFTVNVANPIARGLPDAGEGWDFAFASGPSVRFVVELGPDVPRMSYQLPGGNDLHRESPFYNNLLPNWLENQSIDFPFGPDAVPNPAVSVTVSPGG